MEISRVHDDIDITDIRRSAGILAKFKYAKLQRSVSTEGVFFRIMVRNKRWHLWHKFAESCFPEDIYTLWDQQFIIIRT